MLKNQAALSEVLKKEGVVAIGTEGKQGTHLVATWNSFLQVIDQQTLAIPAGGYLLTQENVEAGSRVQLIIGSKEVAGKSGPGTGFRITAEASFRGEGAAYQVIKEKFPWARAAFLLEIKDVACLL